MKKLVNTVFGCMALTVIAMPYIVLVKALSVGINFGNTVEFVAFLFLVCWILYMSWLMGDLLFPNEESED